jgi:hypothetical protein
MFYAVKFSGTSLLVLIEVSIIYLYDRHEEQEAAKPCVFFYDSICDEDQCGEDAYNRN